MKSNMLNQRQFPLPSWHQQAHECRKYFRLLPIDSLIDYCFSQLKESFINIKPPGIIKEKKSLFYNSGLWGKSFLGIFYQYLTPFVMSTQIT